MTTVAEQRERREKNRHAPRNEMINDAVQSISIRAEIVTISFDLAFRELIRIVNVI